ncbi:ABC transporter substrate-binding protein [Mobilicoccus pelagius]|uniref:Putative peptide ABC transporter substrate-binding protein n=1 Tax=Mobilicoccus pelagius NBRC 104925 TaxID=1089455 RepID=H5URG1_9MICO|nr:ABC transporter substrate-binding protein [Mobilicoccus pelagius]GAB48319.1 putative peptide ABC transporter substrate-binding protein [Mobilicoccus pelagius NBRC 104925]
MRRTALLVPTLALALAASACGANAKTDAGPGAAAGSTTQTPARGGTLKMLSTAKEIHFDPAMSQNLATSGLHYITRSLTAWKTDPHKQTELAADLATDTGTTSDGGRTWTFRLRDGLVYADGTPITAADVKFGLERSFDEQLQGGLSYHKVLLEGGDAYRGPAKGAHLASIEAKDDKTLVFHLNRRFADWPWVASMPAFAPVPANKGMGIPAYDHTPPASGPYQVQDYQVGSKVTLARNPAWKPETDPIRPAYPDAITYEMGLNPDTVGQRMADDSGDDKNATGPTVSAALIPKVNADPALKSRVYVSPSGASSYLVLNMSRPGLKDLKVRQAINYAVDKQQIQTIAGGPTYGGELSTTFMPPGVKGHKKFDLYPAPPAGDPAKARELLGGTKVPPLTFVVDAASTEEGQMASSIANDLGEIGITVNVVAQDTDKVTDTKYKNGDFDLGFGSWQADYPSAYAALQPLVESSQIGDGNYNASRLDDPKIDTAIRTASSETDPAEAEAQWGAIDEMAMKHAPIVPLYYSRNAFIYGSNVGGSYVPSFPSYTDALVQGLKKP